MSRARTLADLGGQSLATDSELSSAVADKVTDGELSAAVADKIAGDGTITSVIELTQTAYDALTPDATTLYVIVG